MNLNWVLLLVALSCTVVSSVKAEDQWAIEVRAPQELAKPLKEIAANYKTAKLILNFSGTNGLEHDMSFMDAATQVVITKNDSEMDKLTGFILGERKDLVRKDGAIYPVALAICGDISIPFDTRPAKNVEQYFFSESAKKIFHKYGFEPIPEK